MFLHTFVSASRLLAVGEKIIRISSETTGPRAPEQDPLFGLFQLICAAWRLYCELYRLSAVSIR